MKFIHYFYYKNCHFCCSPGCVLCWFIKYQNHVCARCKFTESQPHPKLQTLAFYHAVTAWRCSTSLQQFEGVLSRPGFSTYSCVRIIWWDRSLPDSRGGSSGFRSWLQKSDWQHSMVRLAWAYWESWNQILLFIYIMGWLCMYSSKLYRLINNLQLYLALKMRAFILHATRAQEHVSIFIFFHNGKALAICPVT